MISTVVFSALAGGLLFARKPLLKLWAKVQPFAAGLGVLLLLYVLDGVARNGGHSPLADVMQWASDRFHAGWQMLGACIRWIQGLG